MKKNLFAFLAPVFFIPTLLFVLGVSTLWAASATDDDPLSDVPPPIPRKTEAVEPNSFCMAGILGLPGSSQTASDYTAGIGIEISVYFPVNKNFSFGLGTGFEDYALNAATFAKTYQQVTGSALPPGVVVTGDFGYIPMLAIAKYSFNDNRVRPYGLLGMGFAINGASSSIGYGGQTLSVDVHENSFLMRLGLGLSVPAGEDFDIFFQTGMDIDFTSQNNTDLITLHPPSGPPQTAYGNLSDDGPTIFLPVQVGIRFATR